VTEFERWADKIDTKGEFLNREAAFWVSAAFAEVERLAKELGGCHQCFECYNDLPCPQAVGDAVGQLQREWFGEGK